MALTGFRNTSEQPVALDGPNREVLRAIIDYLPQSDRARLALVCHAWSSVVDEPWQWAGEEARLRFSDIRGPVMDCIHRRQIRKVKLRATKYYVTELPQLVRAFPWMTSLDLSGCRNLLDSDVARAFYGLQLVSLTTLNFNLCFMVSDESVKRFTMAARNLERLHLRGCQYVGDQGIDDIVERLPRLQLLETKKSQISDDGLKTLAGLGQHKPLETLKSLALQCSGRLTSVGLQHLKNGALQLVSLDLRKCHKVDDVGVKHVAQLRSLECLILHGCKGLTSSCIEHLASGQASLTYLDISYCSGIDDNAFLSVDRGPGLLDLKTLKMTACPVTDKALSAIAMTLKNVSELDVSQCKRITADGIAVVSAFMPRLKSLTMRFCKKLSSATLKYLVKIPGLEVVNIEGCSKITGKGAAFMARGDNKTSFVDLDISGTRIGNTGLRYISPGMPKLRRLSMRGCEVKDEGLSRMVRYAKSLRILRVGRCGNITDDTLRSIARHLPSLSHLDVKQCPKITPEGKKDLADKLPHLRFI